ncbi:hypothetical protein Bca52824_066584 [Brassica carinata]|uniref:SAC domain-containing protein n=1 Tax=Brassica carinata TaxID=52824 RepID=A0A8X7QKE6_BRACI|nr:hypothetical protein Bca52824_066584 [Brassica carinata]
MIGRDKNRTFWRVLKLDRTDPTELNFYQDSTAYTEAECFETLRRIHEGNRSSGGLKFVTTCWIIGFVRFLGPYYMLIITKRRKLGEICGHTVYGVAKSKIITIPHASVLSNVAYSKDEKRFSYVTSAYSINLCSIRVSQVVEVQEAALHCGSLKGLFFSYSYHIMHSLQSNLSNSVEGHTYYESMFVWNDYLTRRIRNNAKDCMWTVALVYGFFKQVDSNCATDTALCWHKISETRVNEKGRVANDVETEQIVFEEAQDGDSRLNIRPDIILSAKDPSYEATRLHFENLAKRYGNPIIILNLIKTREKRPRETILRAEFANAIKVINKGLSKEDRLRPLHWDLHKHSRNNTICVCTFLLQKGHKRVGDSHRLATYALNLTGIFYCQLTSDGFQNTMENNIGECSTHDLPSKDETASDSAVENGNDSKDAREEATTMLQKGILRTNCIDCLDRTNVAQYAYGLVAFGRQLHALGMTESTTIDLDNPPLKI